MVIVDTYFLFAAINKNEKAHEDARRIWEQRGMILKFPPYLFWEFLLVLKSRSKSEEEIINLLKEIKNHIYQKKSQLISMNLTQLIEGLEIFKTEMKRKHFFDSLIAACAKEEDGVILSDDSHFDKVKGITRIPLADFRKQMKK